MQADTQDRPGIRERYETAGNTSNLAVESHRGGAGDVLIAAGWSPATLGGAIMRMHSEFRRPPQHGGRTDAILAIQQLRTMPAVVQSVGSVAMSWGMEDGFGKAREVVAWWLDHVCPKCQGRKKQLIQGTPTLSERPCPHADEGGCGGTGETRVPHGREGRRLATYMDECVADWHGFMKKNLANVRRARNKVVDTPSGRVIIAAEDGTGC